MYKAIILPLAKQDIKEAAHWYNETAVWTWKAFHPALTAKSQLYQAEPQGSSHTV